MAITQAFTRASVATHTQPDGSIVEVPVDEPRFAGLRRTSNWIHTTDLTDATWINWWTTPKNVTPGQADPFGGTTAWHVVAISDGTHEGGIIYQALPGNELPEYAYTCVSVWLRADTPVTIRLAAAISGAIFGDTPIQVTTSWQRFSTTGKKATYQLLRSFGLFTENVNTNLDVYMCNPQVEWSSSPITNPGDFVAPGDSKYIDYDGYIVGAANVVTASKGSQLNGGLLIEKAATNLVQDSANIQPWGGEVNFLTWEYVPSIFSGGTAFKATSKTAGSKSRSATVTISTADQPYVLTVWLEVFANSANTVGFGVSDTGGSIWGAAGLAIYTPSANTFAYGTGSGLPTNPDATISHTVLPQPGPNGGQLVKCIYRFNGKYFSAASRNFNVYPMYSGPSTGGVDIFHGSQLETGSEPSSFIITGAAEGTRAADSLVYTGIPVPNQVNIPGVGIINNWDGVMPSGNYVATNFCVLDTDIWSCFEYHAGTLEDTIGSATETFTRASVATHTQPDGSIVEVPVDEPRFAGLKRVWNRCPDDSNSLSSWTMGSGVSLAGDVLTITNTNTAFGSSRCYKIGWATSIVTANDYVRFTVDLEHVSGPGIGISIARNSWTVERVSSTFTGPGRYTLSVLSPPSAASQNVVLYINNLGVGATVDSVYRVHSIQIEIGPNSMPAAEYVDNQITHGVDTLGVKYIDYDGYDVGADGLVGAKRSQLNGGLLIEKAATNLVFPSYQPTISPSFWAFIGAYAINNNDGSVTLSRVPGNINNSGRIYKAATLTDVTISFEARTDIPVALVGYVGTWASRYWSTPVQITSQWTRFVCTPPVVASSGNYGIGIDWDNTPDGDYTVHFRNMQVETGREATSLIVTTGAEGTRAADSLVYTGIPTPNHVEIPEAGFTADAWDGTMPPGNYVSSGFCVKESN